MIARRAFSYTRFSTPEQLKGDSLRRQTSLARAYCERNGLTLDTNLVLQDLGVSAFRGANAKRGALASFFHAIEDGEVIAGDVLIVENLDRLSRENPLTAVDLLRSIIDKGVSVVTLVPEMVLSKDTINSLAVLLPMFVQASLANSESVKKSERLGEAWAEKRARLQKEKFTARAHFWLRLSDDRTRFDLIPEKAEIVRRIFADCRDGYGLISIAQRLNEAGVPPPRGGALWSTASVRNVLRARATFGEFQPRSRGKVAAAPIADYYPAVVTEEEFDAAAAALDVRRNTTRGRVGKGVANLFTGKLYDARDRSPIYVAIKPRFQPGDRQRILSEAARRGRAGGRYKSIPYRLVEGAFVAILNAIDHWAEKPTTRAAIDKAEKDADALTAKIRKLQARVEREDDVEPLLDVLQSLARQEKDARRRIASLKEEEAGQRKADLEVAHDLANRLHEGEDVRRRLKAKVGLLVAEMWVVVFDTAPWHKAAELQVRFKNGTQAAAHFGQSRTQRCSTPRHSCFTSIGPIPKEWDLRHYSGWYDGSHEENTEATFARGILGEKTLLHTTHPMDLPGDAEEPPP